jgi:hypothetical protein
MPQSWFEVRGIMVAMTAVGGAVLVIVVSLAVALAVWSVIASINHFRIWRLRQRGLDRCRFCGTQLATIVDRMDFPIGFASVCSGCGRDQGRTWD